MMEAVVTTGAISRAKLQSNHHHQQTNTQSTEGKNKTSNLFTTVSDCAFLTVNSDNNVTIIYSTETNRVCLKQRNRI